MTILYADDDADDRAFFVEAFGDIDPSVSCVTACDGKRALDLLGEMERLPDYLFLDINMPVMDGRECLYEIKKSSRFKNIPVVIYSTTSDPEEIGSFYKSGAALFIRKPDNVMKLYSALRIFLNSSGVLSGREF